MFHVNPGRSSIHRIEEVAVILCLLELVDQEFNGIRRAHRGQNTAQHEYLLKVLARHQQVFLTCTGLENIHSREYTLVRNLAIKNDFGVTCTLKFFEDDFIHTAARIDQSGRDDGQRTAFFDVTRRTKEALRPLEGIRINTACQYLTGRRNNGIVRASEARDRIQQDDDVTTVLDKPLCLFDHHFSDLDVTYRRFIER